MGSYARPNGMRLPILQRHVGPQGERRSMESRSFAPLRERIAGQVTLPSDDDYDHARRVWNGMIERRPVAVARVTSVSDIREALAFGKERSLPIAVRGGGHNVAGNGSVDAGLVLDLGDLDSVVVDPERRTVIVGGGATLAHVDRATTQHGLVVPLGVVSRTGVGGLTLGGGVGWLLRSHGLTVDSLLAAEVVTASGDVVRTSAEENADLFWALSGGGGNFGVVSQFTFRAYQIPDRAFSGNLVYRQPKWRDALVAFADWGRTAPDAVTAIVTFIVPPPDWAMGDEPLMILGFASSSADVAEGEAAIAPLRNAVPADVEVVEPTPWLEWQSAVDGTFPVGVRAYWKNTSFDALDDAVIELFLRRGAEQTWQGTAFDIHLMGGAFARVPEGATAFPSRSAGYWLNIYGFWADEADDLDRIRFVREFSEDMEPFSAGGQYINFLPGASAGEAPASASAVYGEEKLARLVAVKQAWDPENTFRLNHNIPPR